MCDVINAGLDQLFWSREYPQLKVVATPGRYVYTYFLPFLRIRKSVILSLS